MPNLNVGLTLALGGVNSAMAYLQVSAGSAVGTYCYSDCTWAGCLVVVACDCTLDMGATLDSCSNDDNYSCTLGTSGGVSYFCDTSGESACSFCGCSSRYLTDWGSPNSSGVVTRTYETVDDSSYEYCTFTTQTHYGCTAGYYKTSGAASYAGTIYCGKCPSHQTTSGTVYGNTSNGNRSDRTACWLPAGTTSNFSDGSGSGTQSFESTCYYSN